jgi:hypothetical protein
MDTIDILPDDKKYEKVAKSPSQDDAITAALRDLIIKPVPTDTKGRRYADLIAQQLLAAALKGDVRALIEITRRTSTKTHGDGEPDVLPIGSSETNAAQVRQLLKMPEKS